VIIIAGVIFCCIKKKKDGNVPKEVYKVDEEAQGL